MRRSISLLSIAVAVFSAGTAAAQQPRQLNPGDRAKVQFTSESGQRRQISGQVVAVGDGVVVLQRPRHTPDSLSVAHLSSVSVATGQRDYLGGMGKGFLIGAGAGLVVGYMGGESDCSGMWFCYTKEELAAALAVVGGGSGLLLGAIFAPRRWAKAEIPGTRISMTPTVGLSSAGFRLSATF